MRPNRGAVYHNGAARFDTPAPGGSAASILETQAEVFYGHNAGRVAAPSEPAPLGVSD